MQIELDRTRDSLAPDVCLLFYRPEIVKCLDLQLLDRPCVHEQNVVRVLLQLRSTLLRIQPLLQTALDRMRSVLAQGREETRLSCHDLVESDRDDVVDALFQWDGLDPAVRVEIREAGVAQDVRISVQRQQDQIQRV